MTDSDPSALIVPFGKYKGSTVSELLTRDQAYAEWLLAQGWLAQRFAELHAALLSRGAATDETPEHNAIQVRFLEPEVCFAFVFALGYRERLLIAGPQRLRESFMDRGVGYAIREAERLISDCENSISHVGLLLKHNPQDQQRYMRSIKDTTEKCASYKAQLEQLSSPDIVNSLSFKLVLNGPSFEQQGVDVCFSAWIRSRSSAAPLTSRFSYDTDVCSVQVRLEIKPSVGDDYPTVMRQMSRLHANQLLIGSYTGSGASLDQVWAMFRANGLQLISLSQLENEIPAARIALNSFGCEKA